MHLALANRQPTSVPGGSRHTSRNPLRHGFLTSPSSRQSRWLSRSNSHAGTCRRWPASIASAACRLRGSPRDVLLKKHRVAKEIEFDAVDVVISADGDRHLQWIQPGLQEGAHLVASVSALGTGEDLTDFREVCEDSEAGSLASQRSPVQRGQRSSRFEIKFTAIVKLAIATIP